MHFPLRGGLLGRTTGYVYAADGVTFTVDRGEALSIAGESGCGKSTVGTAILRLIEPTDGLGLPRWTADRQYSAERVSTAAAAHAGGFMTSSAA